MERSLKADLLGTWKMTASAFENLDKNYQSNIQKAMIEAIVTIEDSKEIHTVGRYSYPNAEGFLQLDAAFMDGNANVGAIMASRHICNPIKVAHHLMQHQINNVLTGDGADLYAQNNGFKICDTLEIYPDNDGCKSHDTVGVIGRSGINLYTGLSSSGRKGKHLGRVGDSPLVGSGYYAQNGIGAAVATGDGEVILKGVLAKEVVMHMEYGLSVKDALNKACNRHKERLTYDSDFCMLAMDKDGYFSAYASQNTFPFASMNQGKVTLWVCEPNGEIKLASAEFLKGYKGD